MYKKKLIIGVVLLFSCILFGCSKTPGETPLPESGIETSVPESINIEDTEPATEYVDFTEAIHQKQALKTYGILKSKPEASDDHGNLHAYFTDANGSDFIAIISSMTERPESLMPGETYEVHHSEIELQSFPGQYPEVYKIVHIETDGSTEADDSTSDFIN